MKKLICITIAISMMLYTYTIAYADVTDYIPEWISYVVDTSQTIIGYDGSNQAYNDYISNSQNSSNIGAIVQALELMRPNSIIQELFPLTKPYDVLISNTQSVYDGRFRAAVVNRDFIDRLYSNVNGYEGLASRYKSLSDYGIVISDNIDYNNNISVVDDWFTLDSKGGTAQSGMDGYIDISAAKNYNGISILSGNNCPPIMYIPPNYTIYQNGHALRNVAYGMMCVLIDDTKIYGSAVGNYPVCSWYLYHNGSGLYDVTMGSSNYTPVKSSYDRWVASGGVGFDDYVYSYINASGTVVGRGQVSYLAAQEMIAQTGVLIKVGDTTPTIDPPDNIPYDDNGNTIIMIPIDNNNDVTYQDIKYISPTTYKQYYDNGDITTSNYTYNNDSQYINTTINNYYNYVINNNGSGYDDTTLLNKLDIIIDKLTDIIDAVKNIATSDVPGVKIFSSTPIYTDFGDCVTKNVSIAGDIDKIYDGIDTTQSENVGEYIDRFKGEFVDTDADTDTPYTQLLHGITLNTNWYEPYRLRVRNILKIPCWIFAIIGSWTVIKSVFGVRE